MFKKLPEIRETEFWLMCIDTQICILHDDGEGLPYSKWK